MAFHVRPMQADDIDSVYAIEISAYRAPLPRDILDDCLHVGYDCRVVELDLNGKKEIISYVICRYQAQFCHVLNLCVSPQQQNRGYGQYLLQAVIDSLIDTEIEMVHLEVRPSNLTALRLYQRMGFQQVKVKRGYYRDQYGIEDAIVLSKNIS